jgi:tetraacyldisaccharide 4'-kinase
MTAMLSLIAYIYGKVIDLRNALYDRGIFDVHDLRERTLSIGNITAGGTGKTPLVAYVAELLAERGEKVCILTRGYGRDDPKTRVLVSDGTMVLDDPRKTGDEPLELAKKLLGKAIVIADADRVAAADWARRKFGITAFVFDDGFQHRKAKRDIDIVCIDATDPFGGGEMLPVGRLREPMSNLARATAFVITRSDLVDAETISNLKLEIAKWDAETPIFTAKDKITKITSLNGEEKLGRSVKVFAFCGLGNPNAFFRSFEKNKMVLTGKKPFRDHHPYTPLDIVAIEEEARASGATALVTTAKDAVKLSDLKFTLPCFVVGTTMEISDADKFAAML